MRSPIRLCLLAALCGFSAVRAQAPPEAPAEAAAQGQADTRSGAPDEAATAPYRIEVWSDAHFGPDGALQRLDIVEPGSLTAAFVERVRAQLAGMRIAPVKDADGAPARFSTGVQLRYEITPGAAGATVRLLGTRVAPRPIRRTVAARPAGLPADTPVAATVRCTVGVDGRCGEAVVVQAYGTSAVIRRWALASLQGWEFEPQRVNDRAVAGETEVTLVLRLRTTRPADFRSPQKL